MAERLFRAVRTKPAPVNGYDRILHICLWLCIFLVPIFFLPGTTDPLEQQKALVFYLLVLIGLVTWLLKSIVGRGRSWTRSPFDLPLVVFVLLSALSTVFSYYHYRSIAGLSGYVNHSFTTVLFLFFFFLLVVNTVRREHLPMFFSAFLLSGAVIVLFNFLQVFSLFVFPWGFAQIASFNLASNSPITFSLYLAVLGLVSLYKFLANHRPVLRVFVAFVGILSLFLLMVYDQPLGWYAVILGLVLLLVFLNRSQRELKPLYLVVPTVLIGIALLGLLLNTQALLQARLPGDVILPLETGWRTTVESLKHRPLLGSGPETFDAVFAQYRPQEFNETALWNLRFQKSSNEWFQLIATVGILTTLAFAVLLGLFLWHLWRDMVSAKPEDPYWWYRFGALTGGTILVLSLFFLPSNFLSTFLLWFFLAFGVVLTREKEPAVAGSDAPRATLPFMIPLGFSLVVVLGIVFLYFAARFWFADRNVAWAQVAVQRQENLEAVRAHLADAVTLNPYEQGPYFSLAQNLLVQAQLAAQEKELNVTQVRTLLTGAAASANTGAVKYDEYSGSYESLAALYRSIDALSGTVSAESKDALTKAVEREPNNPTLHFSLGQYYLGLAQQQTREANTEQKDNPTIPDTAKDSLRLARETFTKAAERKTGYLDAKINVALVLRLEGNAAEATKYLEELANDNPTNTDVLFNLAENYRLDGNTDQAVTTYQRIIAILPGHSDAHFRLAQIYEERKDTSAAIAELEIVQRLNPGNAEVEAKLKTLKGE